MGEESEDQTPLLELDSHSRIRDLSSVTIEEFLENGPVAARWWPRLVAWESRLLWILSGSSIIVSVTTFMLTFVTLMFAGHLGTLELAGASANVGIQGLAYGIMFGDMVQPRTGSNLKLKHPQHELLELGHAIHARPERIYQGIWWGMIAGVLLQTITLIILTARTNWDTEVQNAAERLKKSANEDFSGLVEAI
ncbi:hypothetical protein NC651_014126 [Populus alba x Populus x berolinensis]|nr:hypothetical protein NC651_014126 [Populus alba x Populus x berolinensis]